MEIPTFNDRWIVTFVNISSNEGQSQFIAVPIHTHTQEEISYVVETAFTHLEIMYGLTRKECYTISVAPLVSFTPLPKVTNLIKEIENNLTTPLAKDMLAVVEHNINNPEHVIGSEWFNRQPPKAVEDARIRSEENIDRICREIRKTMED